MVLKLQFLDNLYHVYKQDFVTECKEPLLRLASMFNKWLINLIEEEEWDETKKSDMLLDIQNVEELPNHLKTIWLEFESVVPVLKNGLLQMLQT